MDHLHVISLLPKMEEVGTMSSILKKFDTPSSLVDNLASQIIKDLEDAILKGEATLLVSGEILQNHFLKNFQI